MEVVIRSMQLEDIPKAHEIDVNSFSLPWSERSYRFEITENKNSYSWVAEVTGSGDQPEIVGLVVAWLIIDEAHIGTIAVDPRYRRMGIGKKLMIQVLKTLWQVGAVLAYLEVRRSNLAAQKLYEELGFEVEGVRRHYYHDNGEDALLMTLKAFQPEKWE